MQDVTPEAFFGGERYGKSQIAEQREH